MIRFLGAVILVGCLIGCGTDARSTFDEFDPAASNALVMGHLSDDQVDSISIFDPPSGVDWPTATQLTEAKMELKPSDETFFVLLEALAPTEGSSLGHPGSADVWVLTAELMDGRRVYVRLLVGREAVYVMPLPAAQQWDVHGFPSEGLHDFFVQQGLLDTPADLET